MREGRSFYKRGGLGLIERKRGGGRDGTGGATQSVRGNYKSFNGMYLTVLELYYAIGPYNFSNRTQRTWSVTLLAADA